MAEQTLPPQSLAPLLDLANTIYANASILTHHNLRNVESDAAVNGETSQNSKQRGPPPKSVVEATFNLLQAASDIAILAAGPANYLKTFAYSVSYSPYPLLFQPSSKGRCNPGKYLISFDPQYHEITALSVVLEFNIAHHVPTEPGSSIPILELSKKVNILPSRLERIIRLLFLKRVFHSPSPGEIAHTPTSTLLASNHELAAFLSHCTHEAFPAASRLKDALRMYPENEKPNQAAFNVAFQTEDPLFDWLVKRPERFENFNEGMKGISQGGGRSGDQVVGGYDWNSLGHAQVVDVSFDRFSPSTNKS